MKLIACRNIARVPAMSAIKVEGQIHDQHIHKGAIFELGDSREERLLASRLIIAGCVGNADDPKVVKAVQDEIAIDRQREANIRKMNQQAHDQALGNALAGVLSTIAQQ